MSCAIYLVLVSSPVLNDIPGMFQIHKLISYHAVYHYSGGINQDVALLGLGITIL